MSIVAFSGRSGKKGGRCARLVFKLHFEGVVGMAVISHTNRARTRYRRVGQSGFFRIDDKWTETGTEPDSELRGSGSGLW